MAAILEKNRPDGKPIVLPNGVEISEIIQCPGCSQSHTLAYGAAENRIQDEQNVVETFPKAARALLAEIHPMHDVEMYVWGGLNRGWLDREQATAVGM